VNAVDDGIVNAHLTAADLFFLIACILAFIGAIIAYPTKTLWATLVAAALGCVSLGLFLL
jgi:hypothetical protein